MEGQPLCFSERKEYDRDKLCPTCRGEEWAAYNYMTGEEIECTCGPRTYKVAILCKVFTLTTPARGLDITTPLKFEIYDLKGHRDYQVDEKFTEIIYDQQHKHVPSFTIVLDGSLVEDSYREALGGVDDEFQDIPWDFKGKMKKSRYVEFAAQRLNKVFETPSSGDLKPENDHFGMRKKGTSHAGAGGKKKGN